MDWWYLAAPALVYVLVLLMLQLAIHEYGREWWPSLTRDERIAAGVLYGSVRPLVVVAHASLGACRLAITIARGALALSMRAASSVSAPVGEPSCKARGYRERQPCPTCGRTSEVE